MIPKIPYLKSSTQLTQEEKDEFVNRLTEIYIQQGKDVPTYYE